MITAADMRRVSMGDTAEIGQAEARIREAAEAGRRVCSLQYSDADVARDIHNILVDQRFSVATYHNGECSVLCVRW